MTITFLKILFFLCTHRQSEAQCSKLTFLVSCPGTSSGWHLLVLKAILLVLSTIHHLATNM